MKKVSKAALGVLIGAAVVGLLVLNIMLTPLMNNLGAKKEMNRIKNTPLQEQETVIADASEAEPEHEGFKLMDGEKLTEDELSFFQSYLNQRDNNGFATVSYESPDKINWASVLYNGAGIENCEYSQEDLDAYLEADEFFDSVEYDLVALSGQDVRDFVEAKTGIKDFDVSLVRYTYVEDSDILFHQVSDTNYCQVTCTEGVKNGDMVQVVVSGGMFDMDSCMTMTRSVDSPDQYLFVANRELWEKGVDKIIEAPVTGSGEITLCGVKYTNLGPDIEIIKDNSVVQTVRPRRNVGDSAEFDSVDDIAFCDVDKDGAEDMIVIMSRGGDAVAVLLSGNVDDWGNFEYGSYGLEAITDWIGENVSDLTAKNVIEFLSVHPDEIKNFRVKVSHARQNKHMEVPGEFTHQGTSICLF